MSGHNKWSKVKRIKGPLDAKRSKVFTKMIKEITVAARLGGGSLDGNPRLRTAVQIAKDASMPKDNIERAILKGTGELEGDAVEEATYEGYGPGGVAILVETASDNKNRTVQDLRNLFKSGGGNMGEIGSVAWMFSHFGQLVFDKAKHPEDTIMEVALEAGAQDVSTHDGTIEVLTAVSDIYKVKETFDKVGIHPTDTSFTYVPKTTVPIESRDAAQKLIEFLDSIEDHEDVQRIHSNMEIDDRLLSELAAK